MCCLQNQSAGPVTLDKDGNVAIKIQAKPGAKCNNVTGTQNISLDKFNRFMSGESIRFIYCRFYRNLI